MDKLWIVTAVLVKNSFQLVSLKDIKKSYESTFHEKYPESLEQQIISWKRRYFDKNKSSQGGSRNRYFFRTSDGDSPHNRGEFRLFRESDVIYDGIDKSNGPVHPSIEKIPTEYHYLIHWYRESYYQSKGAFSNWLEIKLTEAEISATAKESLVMARRGQGIFRENVINLMNECPFTGVSDKFFLVASHIKPWSVCNNKERLDGWNGLLLSPHVDRLFDKGFITFDSSGRLIQSTSAKEIMHSWGLSANSKIPLHENHESYMKYHRASVFKFQIGD